MGGFQGKEVMHSGTANGELINMGGNTVGVPAGTFTVLVPTVNSMANTVAVQFIHIAV